MILPDHLHAIRTLSEQDADSALRWGLIKSAFSHRLMRGERISTAASVTASAGFANGGIGSIRSVTKTISAHISTIFTSIR